MNFRLRPRRPVSCHLRADMDENAALFRATRTATETLCEPLAIDDYTPQSMPDASPAKWHLAHTSWFFEEFVLQPAGGAAFRFYDESYRHLFNSYYDAVGPRHSRPSRGLLTRPTVAQVRSYRRYVDERVATLLERDGLTPEQQRVVTLGIHHEQQHQELLLTDLKHLLSRNPLLPAYTELRAPAPRSAPPLEFRRHAGGLVDIGHRGDGFCFDNELAAHRVHLESFRIAARAVTNGEFHEFIDAGGYAHPGAWLAEGWEWLQRENVSRPLYWLESLDREFTLLGVRELDPAAPACHLSYYEADAFARWAGMRLPTEFEWETAARESRPAGTFADDALWHPRPATLPFQMFGDVWEWTASAYAPYPGFAAPGGALGEYNGKFMVSQLVLRGGSCATPRSHIRPTYRNFFHPHACWQFSGVRLAGEA
jgi:ergothioneine biosynthesis protein EgtB